MVADRWYALPQGQWVLLTGSHELKRFISSVAQRSSDICMADQWGAGVPGLQYKDESIAAMILWQALGGRADTYNFESFYGEGPHTVIPESNPISYTGLVYCALR